jgi:Skp family chaperone for outer membrane proteins
MADGARTTPVRVGRSLLACAVVGVACVAATAVYTKAQGGAPQATAAPTRVALVDLERLMAGLNELKDRNKTADAAREGYFQELKKIQEELKTMEINLKDNIPREATQERMNMRADILEKRQLLEFRTKRYDTLWDQQLGVIIRDLYTKTTRQIDAFAKREGFDLVLLDDRAIKLPEEAGMKDVNGLILNKRVLFASDALDITDRLVQVMNNEYAAGANK